MYFLEAKNLCFVTKNCWKSSYICVFILSKKWRNWFHKNLHNSGMVGRRKLPDPLLNHILNVLSIGVQYTLSFELTNFGLKYLIIDAWQGPESSPDSKYIKVLNMPGLHKFLKEMLHDRCLREFLIFLRF